MNSKSCFQSTHRAHFKHHKCIKTHDTHSSGHLKGLMLKTSSSISMFTHLFTLAWPTHMDGNWFPTQNKLSQSNISTWNFENPSHDDLTQSKCIICVVKLPMATGCPVSNKVKNYTGINWTINPTQPSQVSWTVILTDWHEEIIQQTLHLPHPKLGIQRRQSNFHTARN